LRLIYLIFWLLSQKPLRIHAISFYTNRKIDLTWKGSWVLHSNKLYITYNYVNKSMWHLRCNNINNWANRIINLKHQLATCSHLWIGVGFLLHRHSFWSNFAGLTSRMPCGTSLQNVNCSVQVTIQNQTTTRTTMHPIRQRLRNNSSASSIVNFTASLALDKKQFCMVFSKRCHRTPA
jgi:hypothetical protein